MKCLSTLPFTEVSSSYKSDAQDFPGFPQPKVASRFLFRDCRSFSFLVYQLSRLFLSVKGYCVDMINKIKHGFVQIWNFSSRVQLDISLVSYHVELSKRNSLSTRVYVYKRATYLWNLIRSMIEAVSKNGNKIHRDELHSALRVGIQKMENYEYPYNLLMSMFFGGGFRYCWFAKGSLHVGKYSTRLLDDKWLCLVVWLMMTIISWCLVSWYLVSW